MGKRYLEIPPDTQNL